MLGNVTGVLTTLLAGVAAISLITLCVSGWMLAGRVRRYNERSVHTLFAYVEVVNTEFEFAGRPVRVSEETDPGLGHAVRIAFGEDSILLPVAIEPRQHIPGLFNRNSDWMRMLFFADRAGLTREQFV